MTFPAPDEAARPRTASTDVTDVPDVPEVTDVTDVVDVLSRQHASLRAALDTAFAAIGTERYRAVQRLRGRLDAHLDAERRVLDPVVRAGLDDGRQVLAVLRRHEDAMRRTLDQTAVLGDYAEEYGDVLTRFETHLLAHISVTEVDLFPALREVFEPAELRRLGREFSAPRQRRTRSRWAVLPFLRAAS
jgi:hypothetical protein